MSFTSLTEADVAAKAPLDDALFEKIQDDLDDLNSRIVASAVSPMLIEVQGRLTYISTYKRSQAAGYLQKAFTPTQCRWLLKKSGSSGTLGFDLRAHTQPKTPITGISHQYTAATSSIAIKGSALSTQSITRASAQILTQSVSFAKAAANIQSISSLGYVNNLATANCWQYDLDVALDSDTVPGDSILIASATNGANNGTFVIVEVGRGGGANFVISNASGVAQAGAVGNVQPQIISYNFTNPVSGNYTVGYSAHFATHTSGLNNGDFTIFKINSSGNNIWVKNPVGIVQGSAAGTTDTNLFLYNMTGSVSTTDYIVGEKATCINHTSGNDNGVFTIAGVNVGVSAFNVMLHVSAGVTQGGVLGSVNTNRWIYNLPSDPTASSNVLVGDSMVMLGHTNANNDGTFTVKAVTSSTIVVYNESGATQNSTPGNVYTARKLIQFGSDQSANYSTLSFIEMQCCIASAYNAGVTVAPFQVLQINRGGGANYNVVISNAVSTSAAAGGYVQTEMKSIFTVAPSISPSLTALEPDRNLIGSSTSLVNSVLAAQTPIMLYFTSMMAGDPQDFSLTIL